MATYSLLAKISQPGHFAATNSRQSEQYCTSGRFCWSEGWQRTVIPGSHESRRVAAVYFGPTGEGLQGSVVFVAAIGCERAGASQARSATPSASERVDGPPTLADRWTRARRDNRSASSASRSPHEVLTSESHRCHAAGPSGKWRESFPVPGIGRPERRCRVVPGMHWLAPDVATPRDDEPEP